MMSVEKEAVIDLDSFFKSKDRKKNKKPTKINPTKLLERTKEGLDTGKERNERTRREKAREETREEIVSDLLRKTKEDDEWEDSYIQEVDLANLKIGKMPAKVEEKPKVEVVVTEESEDEEKVDKQLHPWGGRPTNIAISGESEMVERVEVGQPQKYIPPSQRASSTVGHSRAPKKAPNIGNSTDFPSLREAVDIETEDSSWSKVIKGGHCEKSEKPAVVTRNNNTEKITTKKVSSTESKAPPTQPAMYVPPHRRKTQLGTNDNKYGGLTEESLN